MARSSHTPGEEYGWGAKCTLDERELGWEGRCLWGEPGGLPCIQPPGHYPASGHVYHDPTGSEIDAEPPSADHS